MGCELNDIPEFFLCKSQKSVNGFKERYFKGNVTQLIYKMTLPYDQTNSFIEWLKQLELKRRYVLNYNVLLHSPWLQVNESTGVIKFVCGKD